MVAKNTKKGYLVWCDNISNTTIAVVATSRHKAKRIAIDNSINMIDIDMNDNLDKIKTYKVKSYHDKIVKILPVGVLNKRMELIYNFSHALDNYPCDICKEKSRVYAYKNKVLCCDCIEFEEEIEKIKLYGTMNKPYNE